MTDVRLYTGYVVTSFPYNNHYVVNTTSGQKTVVALESGGSRAGGHVGGGAYMPGTQVLVAEINRKGDNSKDAILPDILVGAFIPYPKSYSDTEGLRTDFDLVEVIQESLADFNNNPAIRHLFTKEGNGEFTFTNQDRSQKRPLDTIAGDWAVSNVLGGICLLSDFFTKVGASQHASMSFHDLDSYVNLSGKNIDIDTEGYLKQIVARGTDSLVVENFAYNIVEGMGGVGEIPFVPTDDENNPNRVVPATEDQIGFFRRVHFQGGSVEGGYDTIKAYAQGAEGEDLLNDGNGGPGMFEEMRRMDGTYRLRAAREVKMERTGVITVPYQAKDIANTPREEYTYEPPEELSFEERSALIPIGHELFAQFEEDFIYWQGLRKDGEIWVFPSKDAIADNVFGDISPPSLPVLSENQQEYQISDLGLLFSDPIEAYPGRMIRLFKNSSVFLMAEDGGLILGDGYGGEIRMSKGKVTIASAGDIDILPGRDLRELVPGNKIVKAGDRLELASTRGSVAIKAEENMQLLSGNGGNRGMTTIENRANASALNAVTESQLRAGEAVGGGIMLKSTRAGVSMLGSYIFGGGYSGAQSRSGQSQEGVQSKSIQCDIMLDSGSGNTLLTGGYGSLSFRSGVALTMLDTVTGLYLNSGQAIMAAQSSVNMVSSIVSLDKGESTQVQKYSLERAGIRGRDITISNSASNLIVHGNVLVEDSIANKGNIISEGRVSANDGANEQPLVPPFTNNVEVPESPAQANANTIQAVSGATFGLLQNMVNQGVATEYGQKITGFAFPDSASNAYRAQSFELFAPKWQSLLEATATWIENRVDHDILDPGTFPYPGREIYEDDRDVLVFPNEDGSLGTTRKAISQYPVNLETTGG
jgi:hypothetical protein